MPRAPQLKNHDAAETASARVYVAKAIRSLIGTTLKPEGGILINEKSGSRYALSVCSIGNDGNVTVMLGEAMPTGVFDPGTTILHAGGPCTIVAIFEPHTSEMMLVPIQSLMRAGIAAELRSVVSIGPNHITFNYAWAKNALSKKTGILGRGGESYMSFRQKSLATKEDFCHLHVHSEYSFLDGVNAPEDLVRAAVENGQPGLGLTDHGYMFGTFKFYDACREAGIKPVLGCEIYVVDDASQKYRDRLGNVRRHEYHLTVLAMNNEGWKNLCTMVSVASRDYLYYVPRVDWAMLEKYSAGLIVLTGCFKGEVAWHLQKFQPRDDISTDILKPDGKPVYSYDPDRSRQRIRWFKRVFGDRVYGEAHGNDFDRYMASVPDILQMCHEESLPVTVQQDSHYARPEDAAIQAIFSRISQGAVGDEAFKQPVYYLRTIEEMQCPLFTRDMFSRSCEIMDRCQALHIPLPGDPDFKFLFPTYAVAQDEDWAASQAAGATR